MQIEIDGRLYTLARIALCGPECIVLGDIIFLDVDLVPEDKAVAYARQAIASGKTATCKK